MIWGRGGRGISRRNFGEFRENPSLVEIYQLNKLALPKRVPTQNLYRLGYKKEFEESKNKTKPSYKLDPYESVETNEKSLLISIGSRIGGEIRLLEAAEEK